jgi:mannose-6-phosphate isomerase-like protein (cupin superfamily)
MKFFNENTHELARKNRNYREVLFTDDKSQLVMMSITPGDEIPKEIHKADQIFLIIDGTGKAILDGIDTALSAGHTLIIPMGTTHTIINTGSSDLKLITIYTPPQHAPRTIHKTKADAEKEENAGY